MPVITEQQWQQRYEAIVQAINKCGFHYIINNTMMCSAEEVSCHIFQEKTWPHFLKPMSLMRHIKVPVLNTCNKYSNLGIKKSNINGKYYIFYKPVVGDPK